MCVFACQVCDREMQDARYGMQWICELGFESERDFVVLNMLDVQQ
jgi:hypothetical protein